MPMPRMRCCQTAVGTRAHTNRRNQANSQPPCSRISSPSPQLGDTSNDRDVPRFTTRARRARWNDLRPERWEADPPQDLAVRNEHVDREHLMNVETRLAHKERRRSNRQPRTRESTGGASSPLWRWMKLLCVDILCKEKVEVVYACPCA